LSHRVAEAGLEGRVVHRDVPQGGCDDVNERFGRNEKVPE